MIYSPEELQALQGALPDLRMALASGALEITYEGKTIRYRSFDELRQTIRLVEDWIAGPEAPRRRPSYVVSAYSRGR